MYRASFGLLGARRISRCSCCSAKVATREPLKLRFLSRAVVMALAFPLPVVLAHLLIFKIPDLTPTPGGFAFMTVGERLASIDPSLPLAVVAPLSLLAMFPVDAIASRILFRNTRLVRVVQD
jgi:hypothetical protein